MLWCLQFPVLDFLWKNSLQKLMLKKIQIIWKTLHLHFLWHLSALFHPPCHYWCYSFIHILLMDFSLFINLIKCQQYHQSYHFRTLKNMSVLCLRHITYLSIAYQIKSKRVFISAYGHIRVIKSSYFFKDLLSSSQRMLQNHLGGIVISHITSSHSQGFSFDRSEPTQEFLFVWNYYVMLVFLILGIPFL